VRPLLFDMLFVPAGDPRKLAKLAELQASAFILDLEDAVAASVKPRARLDAAAAIASYAGDAELWVRVNSAATPYFAEDVEAVVGPGLAGIVLPKAESARDVLALASLLDVFERRRNMPRGTVAMIATIESVRGLVAVDEIACASDRLRCLGFGAGDFSLDLGLEWPAPHGLSPTIVNAKSAIVIASRKAGLEPPHDGVHGNYRDLVALRAEAEQARALGFVGKHAIHPAQIAVIREVFQPDEDELARAREIVAVFDRNERLGVANVPHDDKLLDYPVAERARRLLASADESSDGRTALPLDGIRVLDLSSLYAAPLIATHLGDFGADVVKVEHPRGDDARRWGLSKDGVPLWWKTISRNKRVIALDLNHEDDRDIARQLAAQADVLVENFRPGRLEAWGLGPDRLHELNPRLVVVRVTGFGQTGPYRMRPGFGTLAEAFSGFAHITGSPDGPPTLPPFGLADGVCGLVGTYATMIALYWRDARGGGVGQVIDLSLYEPLFSILGPQITEYTQLGVVQDRLGNRSPRTSPRNTYRTADGRHVAISAGTQQIANRIFAAIGRPELADDERFRDAAARRGNADEIDSLVAAWVADHTLVDVLAHFEKVEAPVAPVYDAAQIVEDAQYVERGSIAEVDDPDLGTVMMANIVPRLSRTPGAIRRAGTTMIGGDAEEILQELGRDGPPPRPVVETEALDAGD
jgi:crotonobetainyl-CoA:carnitine CoA-transferase CaiB-like acyl-CoA transferase/citrate lyase beta subunit